MKLCGGCIVAHMSALHAEAPGFEPQRSQDIKLDKYGVFFLTLLNSVFNVVVFMMCEALFLSVPMETHWVIIESPTGGRNWQSN